MRGRGRNDQIVGFQGFILGQDSSLNHLDSGFQRWLLPDAAPSDRLDHTRNLQGRKSREHDEGDVEEGGFVWENTVPFRKLGEDSGEQHFAIDVLSAEHRNRDLGRRRHPGGGLQNAVDCLCENFKLVVSESPHDNLPR